MTEQTFDQYKAVQIQRRRRALRVEIAQQSAIDIPFEEMARDRFLASSGQAFRAPSARLRAVGALKLVSNATSGTLQTENPKNRPIREAFRIDKDAARVKRMRCSVGHAARLLHFDAHGERAAQRWNIKLLTMTYRRAGDWRPGHIGKFRDALRQWCKRRNIRCRFVWVAELQKRGALHYHMMVWLPKGQFLPDFCKPWWPHGMTHIRGVKSSAVGYLVKYASKTTAHEAAQYPKHARMHGAGGLHAEAKRHIRYWRAPIWVRDALHGTADIRKVIGGYMDKFTGEFLASPWRVFIGSGGEVWTYKISEVSQ